MFFNKNQIGFSLALYSNSIDRYKNPAEVLCCWGIGPTPEYFLVIALFYKNVSAALCKIFFKRRYHFRVKQGTGLLAQKS
jgi:hypothetical protein